MQLTFPSGVVTCCTVTNYPIACQGEKKPEFSILRYMVTWTYFVISASWANTNSPSAFAQFYVHFQVTDYGQLSKFWLG